MAQISEECIKINKLPPTASPYEVLNIPRDSDKSQIKNAYYKVALACHPDKNITEVITDVLPL